MDANNAARSCNFCNKLRASYTCPRCNIVYCCLDCYRHPNHSQCSEEFYKSWVCDALRQERKVSTVQQKQVLEMIKRVNDDNTEVDYQDSDEDSESEIGTLQERLHGLDLEEFDCNKVWERLTDEEKEEFQSQLKAGDLATLVPTWKPWWTEKEKVTLISEVDTESTVPDYIANCPSVPNAIPRLSELLKHCSPSPLVKFNLVNVLYAYAYVAKLQNGDHHVFPLDAAHGIVCLSEVLGNKRNFSSVGDAIYSAIRQIEENRWLQCSPTFARDIIWEVQSIIEGPCSNDAYRYTLAALSDTQKIFSEARKQLKKSDSNGSSAARVEKEMLQQKKLYLNIEKKLQFMLIWIQENCAVLPSLFASIEVLRFEEATVQLSSGKSSLLMDATSNKNTSI